MRREQIKLWNDWQIVCSKVQPFIRKPFPWQNITLGTACATLDYLCIPFSVIIVLSLLTFSLPHLRSTYMSYLLTACWESDTILIATIIVFLTLDLTNDVKLCFGGLHIVVDDIIVSSKLLIVECLPIRLTSWFIFIICSQLFPMI